MIAASCAAKLLLSPQEIHMTAIVSVTPENAETSLGLFIAYSIPAT
jgi:hypothetical protein